MSGRPCSALCSALTVALPPKPPPTTRILWRAVLPIAIAPDAFAVTERGSTAITPSLLTRQERHVAAAPQRDASRADLPETIHGAPRPRPGGGGGVWAASSPRHTRGQRAPRRAAMPHRAARTIRRRSPAPAARPCG